MFGFFSAPILASKARKLGSYLLTETMSHHHQLGMDSYDRIFPNQDTMPKGGFGNLIALPLQKEACKKGNTLFLDQNLQPYRDQWAFLSSISRMQSSEVDAIVNEATRRNLPNILSNGDLFVSIPILPCLYSKRS